LKAVEVRGPFPLPGHVGVQARFKGLHFRLLVQNLDEKGPRTEVDVI